VGMFVCLCLTSKKPSEREFFVPAGTDLGVKLLMSHNTGVCKVNSPIECECIDFNFDQYDRLF
jgi:hypothetical protein